MSKIIIAHYDVLTQSIIAERPEHLTGQKLANLSAYMRNKLCKTDIRFVTDVVVRTRQLLEPLRFRGIATDNQCRIWIMGGSGSWSLLTDDNPVADQIIEGITKRLNLLYGGNN